MAGRRVPRRTPVASLTAGLKEARRLCRSARFNEGCDLYEQLVEEYAASGVQILAEANDEIQLYATRSRYEQYQSRFFDFDIPAGAKVLDIGSGPLPFPLATHLADITLTDDHYGRAGAPIRQVAGKPLYECNIERMPFADKEFDFAYCSHVLEHVDDPERACRELMRVARRGFVETPTRGKDLFLNTAKISGHRWAVEARASTLVFTEYTPEDIAGLACDLLLDMNCAPQTKREKAFAALMALRANRTDTMLLWDGEFGVEVHRLRRGA
jgi:SAM-dependent methyltransferase